MRSWLRIAAACALLGSVACDDDDKCDGNAGGDGDADADGDADGTRRNLLVLAEVPHAHIYREVAVVFTVVDRDDCTDEADPASCQPVADLDAVASWRFVGDPAAAEQTLEAGRFEDNGDGTYTLYQTFTRYGAYAVGLRFDLDGLRYHETFAMSSALAGGEGYQCDLDGDDEVDHVFQLRWSSVREPVADGEDVGFDFLPQRSFNTPVNLDEPWSNSFDFMALADFADEELTIELMTGDAPGTLVEALTPSYAGKGVYRVTRAFDTAQAGETFWFRVSFTDTAGCTVANTAPLGEDPDGDLENYTFVVGAAP